MLRWLRRHRRREEEAPAGFDASIDVEEPDAVAAVRQNVERIPGAGWISVEAHPGARPGFRLFARGSSVELGGEAGSVLRAAVEREVRAALSGRGWASPPPPMQLGFAEAAARSPFEALEQLAAMAALAHQGLTPQPTPLPVIPRSEPPPALRSRERARPPRPAPDLGRAPDRAPGRGPDPAAALAPAPVSIPPEDEADVARLARLLGLVLPADATAPAAAAVRRFGSYAAVLAAPEPELRAVPGLGTHCVAAIKLIHAAAIRLARAGVAAGPVLADRQRLHGYLAAALARERIEQFRILFLDAEGMLRADEVQAQGTVNHTPVYPREVVRRALALGAASIVLVHNHPSGDPAPSREDIEMTRIVREAAATMKIGLRDHVIVGNGRWLSFRDEGLLG